MAAARRSGLGRGLEALLSDSAPSEGFALVPADKVVPNPHQPRESFDQAGLEALAESIRRVGLLQPIVVGPLDAAGNHVLIAGERRLRAARLAGLREIPAMIRPGDDASALAEAVVENMQRVDLGPLEEAAAYRTLLEDLSMTHDQLAANVGKSRSAISNPVRLLNLPPPIQSLVADGDLSAGAARALLGTDDTEFAVKLAKKAAEEGWSVRQVEETVRRHETAEEGAEGRRQRARRDRPAQIIALEERLSDRLGAQVRIDYTARGGGRLTIRFGSVDDLERIYRSLLG